MNSIHFGAGNIGRGFVGYVLAKNDIKVHFVDVVRPLIAAMKNKDYYIVEELSPEKKQTQIPYHGIYHAMEDEHTILELFKKTDIVTTSLGLSNLTRIAPLIAKGLKSRASNPNTIYIMACENGVNASNVLADEVKKLCNHETLAYLDEKARFLNVAVDRIVPNQSHEDLTFVNVEPYYEWVIQSSSLNENKRFEGILFEDNLDAFIERKLLTVNTGHAAIAYLGYQAKKLTIHEALADETIYSLVQGVLSETSKYLAMTHGFKDDALTMYRQKTLKRFMNPRLNDEVTRVARNPLRKLSKHDRLIKPFEACVKLNIDAPHLAYTIAQALKFDYQEDEEARILQSKLRNNPKQAVKDVTGLDGAGLDLIYQIYLEN